MQKKKRGQGMVEFALILPILLMLFFMIIDLALIMQGYLAVNHASREAARFAVTYQPLQGTCLAHNGDTSYPWCPTSTSESDNDYYTRRVEIIKRIAYEKAAGLQISTVCYTESCLSNNLNTPGLFGVRVWGFQSYEGTEEIDKPGLPGLPVRVQVIHNVPLSGFFSVILPGAYFRVSGAAEMINEGVQVGSAGKPLPSSGTIPPIEPPGGSGSSNTPTPIPTTGPTGTVADHYELSLNFATATNILPDERSHLVSAHVINNGFDVPDVVVYFNTDEGSFDYSGSGSKRTVWQVADANGVAQTTIYANEPLVAHISAWADLNDNGVQDADEPSNTAVKTWKTSGPYLIVSEHHPQPNEVLAVQVMDHPDNLNPYALWWCPDPSSTEPTAQVKEKLADNLNVDPVTWDLADVEVTVPELAKGYYRIESHSLVSGTGGCDEPSSLVAYSAPLLAEEPPADLIITGMAVVSPAKLSDIAGGDTIVITVTVKNTKPVTVTGGPFDVNLYVNQTAPPYVGKFSPMKQWIDTLGPMESTVISYSLLVRKLGDNNLWAVVDATNYIDEGPNGGEDNNVYGPLEFSTCWGDDFDDGLDGEWSTAEIGSYAVNGRTSVDSSGVLNVSSTGRTIWSGSNSFYYIYRSYSGDYDARLKLISEPNTNQWAKVGLLARASLSPDAPFVMHMITHYTSPAAEQQAYRDAVGGSAQRISGSSNNKVNLPYWVRLKREGNKYSYYYSYLADPQSESDWVFVNSHTSPAALNLIGIAEASYSSSRGTGKVDDFRLCKGQAVPASDEEVFPPGLSQCEELIQVPGFEGNKETVFAYWRAGEINAYRRTSLYHYAGNFSMRLHASLGSYPCTQSVLHPYLYQEITLPTDVYSISTLVVTGHYFVTGSDLECSNPDQPDPGDTLSLDIRALDDTIYGNAHEIVNGGTVSHTWQTIETDLSNDIDLTQHTGEQAKLYWDGSNDGDYNGTFFYVDNVSAQACSSWPIPDDEAGTASIGGLLTTLSAENNLRVPLVGADVWAYTQDGEIYHTASIQDGTYHFYNIPPGTYYVYSEAWVGGQLRTATANVTVAANERNYHVDMFLQ